MAGWMSQYGLTWASAMVLVAAGVVNAFQWAIEVKERPPEERLKQLSAQPSGEAPSVLSPAAEKHASAAWRSPFGQDIVPVTRLGSALAVDLIDVYDGAVVEVRVADCVDEEIRLVRRGHGFPVKVYDLEGDAPCTVQARRKDGQLWTRWTHPVQVMPGSADSELALALPVERAGGVGMRISPTRDGARVHHVASWTPAWQAGIEPGDVITSVDGQPLAGKHVDRMVEQITGPEGSLVELGIIDVRTGKTLHRTVTRRYLP